MAEKCTELLQARASQAAGQAGDTAPGCRWVEKYGQDQQAEEASLKGCQARAEKPTTGVLA